MYKKLILRILIAGCLILAVPLARAQFTFTTNNGQITITGYTGPGGAVSIPTNINGLPVTSIGASAFYGNNTLTSITMPDGITSIGQDAFTDDNLVSVTIPDSVTSIGGYAFASCQSLTNITLSHSLTNIGQYAFFSCIYLPTITIPSSVTSIQDFAFYFCIRMNTVYFMGNAPNATSFAFPTDNPPATGYYLPGTTGWTTNLSGLPTAPWALPYPLILDGNNSSPSFGVQGNQFGFTVSWATNNRYVIVEAVTNLLNPVWQPLQTVRPTTGSFYFSDPQWANYPGRFYRLRSPPN